MSKISDNGVEFIKREEGCVLTAYRCSANILTIGYGHTGSDVTEGLTITLEEAESLLRDDLERFEEAVNEAIEVPRTQGQFDAMVSLAFNIGVGAFKNSTLVQVMNQGKLRMVESEFLRWNRAGGKVNQGLVNRRRREVELFKS